MIAPVWPVTVSAFAGLAALALLLRAARRRPGPPSNVVPLVRAETPPYDWEREGI